MPRTEARVFTEIWANDQWRSLSAHAQFTYLFLLSQPDLAYDGVIRLSVRRWARTSLDLKPEDYLRGVQELADHHFVLVDHDTEELLIRAFMRRDRVYTQPNLLWSAMNHLDQIDSPVIRAAIAVEVRRILDTCTDFKVNSQKFMIRMLDKLADSARQERWQLGDKPAQGVPSPQWTDPSSSPGDQIRNTVDSPSPPGIDQIRTSVDSASEASTPVDKVGRTTPQDPPVVTVDSASAPTSADLDIEPEDVKGSPKPFTGRVRGKGPGDRGSSRVVTSRLDQVQEPKIFTPEPLIDIEQSPSAKRSAAKRSAVGPEPPPPSKNVQSIVGAWLDKCPARPPGRVIGQISKLIKEMIDRDRLDPGRVQAGVFEWQRRGLHPASLPSVIHELGVPGQRNGTTQATTDARVGAALDIAARRRAARQPPPQPRPAIQPAGDDHG